MSTRRTNSPSGSLAEHGPGFHSYLFKLGYSASAANKHLQLLADLSRWREREGISTGELAAVSTEGFFRRRRAGQGEPAYAALTGPAVGLPASAGWDRTRSSPHRVSATAESSGPLPATRRPPRLPRSPVIMPTVSPAATSPDQPQRPPARRVVGIIAESA